VSPCPHHVFSFSCAHDIVANQYQPGDGGNLDFFDHLALADLAGVDGNPLATAQELARGGIARRRARGARRLKRVERVPRPMTREQVGTLLDVIDRPRDRAMILIMLQGGLRPGEVLGPGAVVAGSLAEALRTRAMPDDSLARLK
jgi:hypothetical protein